MTAFTARVRPNLNDYAAGEMFMKLKRHKLIEASETISLLAQARA